MLGAPWRVIAEKGLPFFALPRLRKVVQEFRTSSEITILGVCRGRQWVTVPFFLGKQGKCHWVVVFAAPFNIPLFKIHLIPCAIFRSCEVIVT